MFNKRSHDNFLLKDEYPSWQHLGGCTVYGCFNLSNGGFVTIDIIFFSSTRHYEFKTKWPKCEEDLANLVFVDAVEETMRLFGIEDATLDIQWV